MAPDLQEVYAARRAELAARYAALPPPGSAAYWQAVERPDGPDALPLEVLARCFRERLPLAAGDAERLFEVIARRVGPAVRRWAAAIAGSSPSGRRAELAADLEQESYLKLWQELEHPEKRFILEHFPATFSRIRQHVAQDIMQKAGEWQRLGVAHPERVPASQTDRLYLAPGAPGVEPLAETLADERAQAALDRVELSDLLAQVQRLPEQQRALLFSLYWLDHTQAQIATALHVTERAVRYRLAACLRALRVRYRGEEAGHG